MAGSEQNGVFAQMKPSAALLAALEQVAGPDGRCAGLTDSGVTGVIGGWAAIAAYAEARQQDAMVALVRRGRSWAARSARRTSRRCGTTR
jgi:hypothetical protein